jgi:hypothetical protein
MTVGSMSMGKGKSLPMATSDLQISVPSMGEAFQVYNANKTPCIQRNGDPVSAVLIRCTLLRYRWNRSLRMALWFSRDI